MNRTPIAAATLVSLVVLVAGCSTDSGSLDIVDISTSQDPFTDTYRPAVAPDVPGKVVVRAVDSACTSAAQATPGGPGLSSVAVHLGVPGYAGTAARVSWQLTAPLPTTGTVLLSLLAASQDGSVTRQLGWKAQGREQIAYFVFDGSSQRSLDGYPDTRVPQAVTGVLSSSDVEALGDNWHWSASLNVDGEDVSTCPA